MRRSVPSAFRDLHASNTAWLADLIDAFEHLALTDSPDEHAWIASVSRFTHNTAWLTTNNHKSEEPPTYALLYPVLVAHEPIGMLHVSLAQDNTPQIVADLIPLFVRICGIGFSVIRHLRQQRGAIVPQAQRQPLVMVTQREYAVIELLAKGLSTKDIAKQMGISASTVKTHREHLREKFEVRSTQAVVIKARAIGMLPQVT